LGPPAALRLPDYLPNKLVTFDTVTLGAGDFIATSSFWLLVLPVANVNSIITKTGTNSNKNGDTFVNFFMAILFDVFIIVSL
jgi:hypothetical protein